MIPTAILYMSQAIKTGPPISNINGNSISISKSPFKVVSFFEVSKKDYSTFACFGNPFFSFRDFR